MSDERKAIIERIGMILREEKIKLKRNNTMENQQTLTKKQIDLYSATLAALFMKWMLIKKYSIENHSCNYPQLYRHAILLEIKDDKEPNYSECIENIEDWINTKIESKKITEFDLSYSIRTIDLETKIGFAVCIHVKKFGYE